MGRRWGKSVLGGVLTMNVLRQHGRAAWIVPSYKNGRSLWRWVQSVAAPLRRYFDISKAERTITTHRGGFFGIYSADNADAIRGEWFHLVVLDEAARIDEADWTDAIQPTLADADGDAILISTPKGRNWFWEEWQRGRMGDEQTIRSWRAPTSANPNPRIQRAAALAAERVPRATYEQEWLAKFVEDGMTRYRIADIDRAAKGAPRPAFERLERVPYPVIQGAIERQARAYPGALWVESNGVGDPVIENLSVLAQPFVTTARTKVQAQQALQLLFEQGNIRALWDARERAALIAASWDEDHTADEEMSLAIFAAVVERPSALSLLSFYQRQAQQQKEATHA